MLLDSVDVFRPISKDMFKCMTQRSVVPVKLGRGFDVLLPASSAHKCVDVGRSIFIVMSFAGPGDLFLIAEEFNYKINKSHDIVK
jgi:hypothetical protein